MENKQFYKKAIIEVIFAISAALVTHVGYNELYASQLQLQIKQQ